MNNLVKNIAIIGSRDFNDYDRVNYVLSKVQNGNPKWKLVIISGGAKGADSLGEKWAEDNNCETIIFLPKWDDLTHPNARIKTNKFGKQYDANAGFRRNKDIVDNSDVVIAFWDGKSAGTKNSIDYANQIGKPVFIFYF